jgi:predicted nucleic acid-binding Zn ribbon protein
VVADHAVPESFEDGLLRIRCSSTTWATQLRFMSRELLARLHEVLGPEAVTRIEVRGPTAPSWSHGRRRVPGRGPRDTYG